MMLILTRLASLMSTINAASECCIGVDRAFAGDDHGNDDNCVDVDMDVVCVVIKFVVAVVELCIDFIVYTVGIFNIV